MSKSCNCASCVACNCTQHRCDVKAARRSAPPPSRRYDPELLTSVSAATYRPPTAQQLREASGRAQKPDWAEIHSRDKPRARFEAESVTRSTYRGEQNPPPASHSRPFFDRGSQGGGGGGRPTLPFTATSAYSEQYPERDLREAQPNVRVDPKRHLTSHFALRPEGARFDGETTSRREYRAWDLAQARPQTAQPAGSRSGPQRPTLKFEGQSQTHAAFTPKERDPSQPLGHRNPRPQPYVESGQRFYEGDSVTRESEHRSRQQGEQHSTYRGQQNPRPAPAAAPSPKPRPSLPFEGQSQTHADYVRHENVRPVRAQDPGLFRSHFAPSELWAGTPAARGHWDTETSRQYTGKQPERCPAEAWASPIPTPGDVTPNPYRW